MSTKLKDANSEQNRESVSAAKRNHYNHQDRSDSTKSIRLKMPKKGQNLAESILNHNHLLLRSHDHRRHTTIGTWQTRNNLSHTVPLIEE